MPQNFSSTLKSVEGAGGWGAALSPLPHPPSRQPLPALGTRFSPEPASASPPLPALRLGQPLSPRPQSLLLCRLFLLAPRRKGCSYGGEMEPCPAAAPPAPKLEEERPCAHTRQRLDLLEGIWTLSPPPLPPWLAACSFLQPNSPQVWT